MRYDVFKPDCSKAKMLPNMLPYGLLSLCVLTIGQSCGAAQLTMQKDHCCTKCASKIALLSRDAVRHAVQDQVLIECQAAIAKRASFTLHLYRGRPTSANTRRLVIAHFKTAATEHINSKTPLVGVPGQVAWKNGEAGHLYFVTVQKGEEPDGV